MGFQILPPPFLSFLRDKSTQFCLVVEKILERGKNTEPTRLQLYELS